MTADRSRTADPDVTLAPVDGPSPAEDAGLLVGRYEVGELLGRGGSGQVHAARDRLLDRRVAVKFVRALSRTDRVLLRRELTALRLLDLPGVVRLLDDGEDRGQPFLVMELLEGGPVTALAGPWARWAEAARTLAETLARVHHAGVLHRDLKPGNILLDADRRPVITDFGLAQGRSVERSGGTHEGTPRYVPPEQWAGRPCDERSDLYALGAVLWELAVGEKFPPPGEERDRVRRSDAPPEVREVVLALVEDTPARRPASAEAVLAALGGGDAVLGPLASSSNGPAGGPLHLLTEPVTAEDVARWVGEPRPTFLHLAEDAAELLLAGTGGQPARVGERLASWARSGRCHWAEGRLRVGRAALAAIRWEAEAPGLVARLRGRSDEEVAAAALRASDAAWDAGAPERAIGVLESVLPALEDPLAAADLRHRLADRALALQDPAALRRAAWRAQRDGDQELVTLLTGARLCAAHERARAADLLRRPLVLPDALRAWRIGWLAQALGHDPAERAAHLDEHEAWCAADPLRRARWRGWRGLARYAEGRYAEALDDHAEAATILVDRPVERMAALANGAAAALETASLERALALATEASALGRRLRHAVAECGATGLARAALYRAGTATSPETALVDAAAEVSPAHEAQHALTEASVAWRLGDPRARSLALRSAAAWGRLGHVDGRALALALARAAGAEVDLDELARLVDAVAEPSLALQARALAGVGGARPEVWHLADERARADVLSLAECRAAS